MLYLLFIIQHLFYFYISLPMVLTKSMVILSWEQTVNLISFMELDVMALSSSAQGLNLLILPTLL
jgi:hypothetical protein